jgi:hypothetical protein
MVERIVSIILTSQSLVIIDPQFSSHVLFHFNLILCVALHPNPHFPSLSPWEHVCYISLKMHVPPLTLLVGV